MASATKESKDKMATEITAPSGESPRPSQPSGKPAGKSSGSSGGFFTIKKYGQGKWTRLGTVFGILFLACLTGYQAYSILYERFGVNVNTSISIGSALFVGIILIAWWIMNKDSSTEFLIATDSEMKKVNWTSRKELIGSTKVVVIFLFFVAFLLFFIDILFSYFFYLINVLKTSPFH